MRKRKRMADRYLRFSFLSDIEGMKSAIGEMHGKFFPKQPVLNEDGRLGDPDPLPDEGWFIRTIQDKIASHPENSMEYPFLGEPIFEESLVGFVRGNDPIFDRFKEVVGPHHFTPWEMMRWQAENNGMNPPEPEDLGCGLCATGVPCESEIPKSIQGRKYQNGISQ